MEMRSSNKSDAEASDLFPAHGWPIKCKRATSDRLRKNASRRRAARGFTLVEAFIMIAVIAIVAAGGFKVMSSAREAAKENKLSSDTAHVNEVLQIYLANGGALPTTYSSAALLAALKTRADATSAASTMGLTGSVLDARTTAVDQTPEEAASSQSRAVWTGSNFSFQQGPGPAGIKEFNLDDSLAGQAPVLASRDPGVLQVNTNKQWVWDYTDTSPTAASTGTTAQTGSRGAGGSASAPTAAALQPPSVPSGAYPLINFNPTYQTSIADGGNPAGVSQIYYATSSGGSYTLYTGAVNVTPGTTITAFARSIDPDRYSDSAIVSGTITATPVTLGISLAATSQVTYAQAGGAMTSSAATAPYATASLTNAGSIPSQYISSGKFQTYYSYGTGTMTPASTTFSGAYTSPQLTLNISQWTSGATTLKVNAQLRSLDTSLFVSSATASATVSIATTTLSPPTISPPGGYRSADIPVTIAMPSGDLPVGARIYYTVDGSDPGIGSTGGPTSSTATLYSGSFQPGSATVVTVSARVYGPSAYQQWFTPSSMVSTTYTSYILVEGAVVNSASINGTFVGSLIFGAAPNNGTIQFNSGAKVLDGNVYVPGLPEIRYQPPTTTVVNAGAAVVQPTSNLPRTIVAGKDIQSDGTILTSSTDTRQIVDLTGSTSPSNYRLNIDGSAYIEGKIFRRATAPPLPSVTVPTGLTNFGSVSGSRTLPPGEYTSVTANGSDVINIGDPNATTPQQYIFDALNLNSGARINVLGPVIVTMTTNPSISGIFGNSAHPEYLQLNVSVGGNFNMNSSAALYAKLVAPYSNVTLNNIFVGSVVANSLTVNGNGISFTLPPVIGS